MEHNLELEIVLPCAHKMAAKTFLYSLRPVQVIQASEGYHCYNNSLTSQIVARVHDGAVLIIAMDHCYGHQTDNLSELGYSADGA